MAPYLPTDDWLDQISAHAYTDEAEAVAHLLRLTHPFEAKHDAIRASAGGLVTALRERGSGSGVEAFLQTYGLDSKEGVAVMCLAEALLRIPDAHTANKLIEDTFSDSAWEAHLGDSESLFVNASTWGLLLTGKVINIDKPASGQVGQWLRGLVKSVGEPVVRASLKKAMDLMGDQFVLGETIEGAIRRAKPTEQKGYTTSYDMLGEGARTQLQADHYADHYRHAIEAVGKAAAPADLMARPGVSIKLSALDPSYHLKHRDHLLAHLLPRLKGLIELAMEQGLSVSLDAEESSRLDIQLELFANIIQDPMFNGYDGIGFVCQAYQKRAIHVVDWLQHVAKSQGKRIPVRLVKGAYWDSEIKWAQLEGLAGYPVFTRKKHTDVSYLACAARLLESPNLYPQFATHNALTVASIMEVAGSQPFEFQRLYGMGQRLYEQVIDRHPCRVYAPVGGHQDLLAYLIRRLLENGANTSFVNLLRDRDRSLDVLLRDPIEATRNGTESRTAPIPLPRDIYQPDRTNSQGIDFGHKASVRRLLEETHQARQQPVERPEDMSIEAVDGCYQRAKVAFASWHRCDVAQRAVVLEQAAEWMEERRYQFVALCNGEAKKTYEDALAEVREAVDFLRYYAARARELCAPQTLQGPTGEHNSLALQGRGVFVCISPWNFPLAIFVGQVAAALVMGNSVLAKPAEQTPAIAQAAVALLHEAGVPQDALQLLCGKGEVVGAALVDHPDCAGVVFTGSTTVAKQIQRQLAAKDGAIVPLIAETGGQNAMVVDSSALLEHATDDIILSAFGSAGQRCSALRVLFVQDEIADDLIAMVKGAMDALVIGSPQQWATDVPPVIDEQAQQSLQRHIAAMKQTARQWYAPVGDSAVLAQDSVVLPHLFEIARIDQLGGEQFGPILHVIRYDGDKLAEVVDVINQTGYGLTFGLHSRITQTHDAIMPHIRVGNLYVNRSMTGATVGVQPFGGQGLSGTGPKAGGPYYLLRFANERTMSVNSAAIGGNLDLLRGVLIPSSEQKPQ